MRISARRETIATTSSAKRIRPARPPISCTNATWAAVSCTTLPEVCATRGSAGLDPAGSVAGGTSGTGTGAPAGVVAGLIDGAVAGRV